MYALSAGGSSTRRPINSLILFVTLSLAMTACGGDDPLTTSTADAGSAADLAQTLDIQGHRGARGLRPENTLPSFEAALDNMVATLELDMHLSADGIVIVWHDPAIDPAKCGIDPNATSSPPDPDDAATPQAALMISNLTGAELAGYRCDRNPDPGRFPDQNTNQGAVAGDDYSIPTLDEVYGFIDEYAASDLKTEAQRANAAAVRFNIETKRDPNDPTAIGDDFDGESAGAFELAVLDAIDRAGAAARTVIQSFDHRSLWAIHAVDPSLDLAALSRRGDIPDFDALAANGATIWSPDQRNVSAATIEAARAAGLAVVPWTVNDRGEMDDLIELGVDGIITDRPDLAPTGN